jgi:hypothetical protein
MEVKQFLKQGLYVIILTDGIMSILILCEENNEKSLDNIYTDHENETHIYPNPCSGVFYLYNRSELELILKLFDFTGREILSEKIDGNLIKEIQLKNVNSGIYLYKLINDEIEIKSGKISVIQ